PQDAAQSDCYADVALSSFLILPSYFPLRHNIERSAGPKVWEIRITGKGGIMRILIMTTIMALPLMALGQTAEPQQTQGQTKETQATAPAKGKKMRPAQESNKPQAKPETGTNVRGQTNVQGRTRDVNKTGTGMRSSTSQTNVRGTSQTNVRGTNQTTTTVNKDEFMTRHTEVFSLGRHPKEFFVQRYG